MEFPSGGIVSAPGRNFCFLVNVDGTLPSDSGFLFFTSAACACLSRKLCGAASDGVATDSCALGLRLWAEAGDRDGGMCEVFPLTGKLLAAAGDGPSLITSRGCGNSRAEELHADTDSLSTCQGAVSMWGCRIEWLTSVYTAWRCSGLRCGRSIIACQHCFSVCSGVVSVGHCLSKEISTANIAGHHTCMVSADRWWPACRIIWSGCLYRGI